METQRRWVTVRELADELGIHPKAAYRHVELGRIPILKLGRRIFVDKEALAERVRRPAAEDGKTMAAGS